MTDDVNEIEQHLLRVAPNRAPIELRSVILGSMQSELRSARWDRRLARVAAALVCLAVSLNGFSFWHGHQQQKLAELRRPTPRAIVEVAEMITSVTDEETGRRFQQQMLAFRSFRPRTDAHAAMQRAVDEILQTWDLTEKDG